MNIWDILIIALVAGVYLLSRGALSRRRKKGCSCCCTACDHPCSKADHSTHREI